MQQLILSGVKSAVWVKFWSKASNWLIWCRRNIPGTYSAELSFFVSSSAARQDSNGKQLPGKVSRSKDSRYSPSALANYAGDRG